MDNKIKCIIVDDELPARECLQNFLQEYCQDVEVVAQADSARTAMDAIIRHHPDLVFLDVEMPNGNGFDLLRQLGPIHFNVIFVTAFEEYAVTAFRFSATDFLLKPINIKELMEAVERVRQERTKMTGNTNIEALLKYTQGEPDNFNKLVISNNLGFKVIALDKIISCQADGYCTIFHLQGGEQLISTKNLKYYDDLLASQGFQRVHNSFLVNLQHVLEYSSEGLIGLAENKQVPLGNTYKRKFLEFFERGR